ncbi:tRNA-modifying protein YgfZ [Buchnera aphidicola (Cinara cuneomaculata)]|uniref:tRNA-modifying protein YgfZ n=1 Tax=Buchnera aphidicola (Cinara cuneomaculata) TaxID=1660040 RepID=A0A451CY36_9GAMM|nr:tRNA-modifying protein YgfZ [Buchnera aphidicola (Cinara cuneomaculata)]
MVNYPIIYLSKNLSNNMFMELDNWSVISVTGVDKKEYLNNHFTIDINLINKYEYKVGAHCNINGKVWTTFLIFKYKNCYLYLVPSSVYKKHIFELKKYSLFSQIDIFKEKNFKIFGASGSRSLFLIKKFFSINFNENQSLIIINKIIILKIDKPINRFLIVIDKSELINFLKFMNQYFVYTDKMQWLELDIESCFPIIEKNISGKFILQTLSLKKWNAIDFNKGCYYGQEMLCKYENKKINKFIICALIGKNCSNNPIIFEFIEYFNKKLDEKYNAGIVLSWVFIFDKTVLLQVRMKKIFLKNKNIFSLSSNPGITFKIFNY